jgi:hypothetical protein
MVAPKAHRYLVGVRSYHDRNRMPVDPELAFVSGGAC